MPFNLIQLASSSSDSVNFFAARCTSFPHHWVKDDSLADTDNLPKPGVLAAEIVEGLEECLEEFRAVEEELEK